MLADLLQIPTGERYPLALAPRQRKAKTLNALLAFVEGLAATRPVLLVIEDLHWADPTSLELIDLIVVYAPCLRLLVVVTFRPEFIAPWAGRVHTRATTIGRLPLGECARIVVGICHDRPLPQSLVGTILQRTDGVPLFTEELTRAIIESGAECGPGEAAIIPMTLHASLLARLDRLGEARELAQIGAALGRRFSYQMVSAVAAMPTARLNNALARLTGAGLIWQRGHPPDAEYTFKHALVQDAAYGSLPRAQRRALHATIAETLETQLVDTVPAQPELLAHHYTEAGMIERAAGQWGKAGQLSLTRSALQEAAVQLARALTQLDMLPSTPSRRQEQIRLQIGYANALMHTKGYAAPETKAALERARLLVEATQAVGEPPEDPLLLLSVLHGVWVATHVAFDGGVVRELATQFMALAEKQHETLPLVLGHRLMGTSLLYLGEITAGREHLDQAMRLYDPATHRAQATRFGQDVGVAILSNRALALWLLGYPGAACRDADDALNHASDIGQSASFLYALTRIASFHITAANYAVAAAQCERLSAIAVEVDGTYWKATGTLLRGCLLAMTGLGAQAIPLITAGMRASEATGGRLRLSWYLACLAQAHAGTGDIDAARRSLGDAMEAMAATMETWQQAELHRLAGMFALMGRDPNAATAETHFMRALAIAREQQAKSWELRAATSLARLWRAQGKHRRAHGLLGSICASFTEGWDTQDMTDARLLLGDLAA